MRWLEKLWLNALATTALIFGQKRRALQIYRQIAALDPSDDTAASSVGNLSLALNRLDGASAVENINAISFEDILNQGRVVNGAPIPEGKTGPVVTVTRSVKRENYSVPQDNTPADQNWQHQILSHQVFSIEHSAV